MYTVLLCIIIALLLFLLFKQTKCDGESSEQYDGRKVHSQNHGYAVGSNNEAEAPLDYNNYLQSAALEPAIKEQHDEWLNNLMVNYQPRMYSVRDDCDDGETKRWGLLKKDYGNVINEDQNIAIPSGRTCTEGDGGSSRWGGYGIGLCPPRQS